ncbi:MAG: PEP-CTERM sorting domain-containing protein, partial [Opitutaceae bacterium]
GQVDTLRLTVLYDSTPSDGFNSVFNTATGAYSLAAGESIAYTTVSQANFTDPGQTWKTVWANDAFTSVANGNYRFAFGAVGAFGSDATSGNFVDNAFFGFDMAQPPIPEPSTYGAIGALVLIGVVAIRRMKKKPAPSSK